MFLFALFSTFSSGNLYFLGFACLIVGVLLLAWFITSEITIGTVIFRAIVGGVLLLLAFGCYKLYPLKLEEEQYEMMISNGIGQAMQMGQQFQQMPQQMGQQFQQQMFNGYQPNGYQPMGQPNGYQPMVPPTGYPSAPAYQAPPTYQAQQYQPIGQPNGYQPVY